MGLGAHMIVVNNDIVSHSLQIQNEENMQPDGGSSGSNLQIFNNVTLAAFSSVPKTGVQYVEAEKTWVETQSFQLLIDGNAITISESGEGFVAANVPSNVIVDIINPSYLAEVNLSNTIVCLDQSLITVTINNPNPSGWMGAYANANPNFLKRTLNQVCLPGSHDAGMSVLSWSSGVSTSANTQTQTLSIQQQLEAGIRYFDIRPGMMTSSPSSTPIYLSHFNSVTSSVGSLGQDLTSAMMQVNAFITSNPTEIVILKFSHYTTVDSSGFGPNPDMMSILVNDYISPGTQQNIFTTTNANANIGLLTLQDILDSGKRIICVYDDVISGSYPSASFFDTATGIFSLSSNFILSDNYSDTDNAQTMLYDGTSGQIALWKQNGNNSSLAAGQFFNFSYTLSMEGTDYITPSVGLIFFANFINPALLYVIASNFPDINTIPSILYVNAVNSDCPLNAALYANSLMT